MKKKSQYNSDELVNLYGWVFDEPRHVNPNNDSTPLFYPIKGTAVSDYGGDGIIGAANFRYFERYFGNTKAIIDASWGGGREVGLLVGRRINPDKWTALDYDFDTLANNGPCIDDDLLNVIEDEWRAEAWESWVNRDVTEAFGIAFDSYKHWSSWMYQECGAFPDEYEVFEYSTVHVRVDEALAEVKKRGFEKPDMYVKKYLIGMPTCNSDNIDDILTNVNRMYLFDAETHDWVLSVPYGGISTNTEAEARVDVIRTAIAIRKTMNVLFV